MPQELPFPSLVDWDSFAWFADNFEAIAKEKVASPQHKTPRHNAKANGND